MHEGKERRLANILAKDGKTFIVAMDHAAYMPQKYDGLEKPGKIINQVMSSGADALLTTLGTLRNSIGDIGSSATILSVESYPQNLEDVIIQALRYGVDMIKVMVYPFSEDDTDNVWNFQKLAMLADKWSLPIMAEVFPGGFNAGSEWQTIEKFATALRVVAEMGADVIKTYFIEEDDSPEGYQTVLEYAQIPVVILGGEKSNDPKPLLEKVIRGMDAGAIGVAIGRNIWGYKDPDKITAAVASIIHEGKSVSDALKLTN
jgi:DhnA family fructose-bisphosphate aldolase class Ia